MDIGSIAKAVPVTTLIDQGLKKLKNKGGFITVRVKGGSENQVKVVFDWDKPEYEEIIQKAKASKKEDNLGAKDTSSGQ